jgi:hypothetical protein
MTPDVRSRTPFLSLRSVRSALTAPLRLQTYKNFAYLWFAFPLGIVYFTALVTAFSLSIGLLVAVLVLNLSNGIARLWARYTRYMLGARNTTDSATR